jgi:hypothetical protein
MRHHNHIAAKMAKKMMVSHRGGLGNETGQFVHGLIAMDDYLVAKIHLLPEKECDNSAIGVADLHVLGI